MEIKTKLDIDQEVYFLCCDKVWKSKVNSISINVLQYHKSGKETNVTYNIGDNPAGSQYTSLYDERDLHASKQLLLDSL